VSVAKTLGIDEVRIFIDFQSVYSDVGVVHPKKTEQIRVQNLAHVLKNRKERAFDRTHTPCVKIINRWLRHRLICSMKQIV
jgi:hypothetical protein